MTPHFPQTESFPLRGPPLIRSPTQSDTPPIVVISLLSTWLQKPIIKSLLRYAHTIDARAQATVTPPANAAQTFQNVINNELVPTTETRRAICPSTEEPLWESPVSSQQDVDRAVSAGQAAYRVWRALSWDERAEYLNKFADAIEANSQEFVTLLGQEAGKPPQAGGFEMFLVMSLARETPKLRITEEKPIDDDDVRAPSLLTLENDLT